MEEREREGEKRGRGMMEEEGIAVGKKRERRLTKEEAHLIPQNVVADNFVRGMYSYCFVAFNHLYYSFRLLF